tara:strand:- start:1246 stop:1932 length:687 start_codon:yes stop_codon:yes gene_type:complete
MSSENTGIYNLTKFTMLDFHGKMSCIIWFAGCNMQCQYCHNPQIVTEKGSMTLEYIQNFLKSRIGLLEGVVLSGGEATIYKKLPELAQYIKSLGFKVKLDTNGTNPKMVKQMVADGLLDYIALDYKAPMSKFSQITKCKKWDKFQETLDFLVKNDLPFEVRTTWHSALLSEDDIDEILKDLNSKGYKRTFYLQKCNQVDNSLAFAVLPQSKDINADKFFARRIPVEIR